MVDNVVWTRFPYFETNYPPNSTRVPKEYYEYRQLMAQFMGYLRLVRVRHNVDRMSDFDEWYLYGQVDGPFDGYTKKALEDLNTAAQAERIAANTRRKLDAADRTVYETNRMIALLPKKTQQLTWWAEFKTLIDAIADNEYAKEQMKIYKMGVLDFKAALREMATIKTCV